MEYVTLTPISLKAELGTDVYRHHDDVIRLLCFCEGNRSKELKTKRKWREKEKKIRNCIIREAV
jgi:hypothetical protein